MGRARAAGRARTGRRAVGDLRAVGRAVPRQVHRNRSRHGDLGPRRPGDEPRRQGQDARCAGRQVVKSIEYAARRHGRAAAGHGPVAAAPDPVQRRRRHRVVDGVRRQVRPTRCRRGPVSGDAAAGQVLEGEHVTVEINTVFQQLVTRARQDRSRQAERDARRDLARRSTAAARSSARR